MLLPKLSERDVGESAEGSIDPLGMYAIADSLAVRLVPGVRERQLRARFLTAIAVSLSLGAEFDEDRVAKDNHSEPWQVFEWYLVEGLVRKTADKKLLSGLPGRDKVESSIKDGVPVSAKRYLKTPTVFGFHGIYRALARSLDIEHASRLGDFGYRLLSIWEKEQGLNGFLTSAAGTGKSVRSQLIKAIEDGLTRGAVDRSAIWSGWNFFADYLGIRDFKRREAKMIFEALTRSTGGFRGDVLRCLVSDPGKTLWKAESQSKSFSERRFHELLYKTASPELRELLDAISSYERFCRLLQDAFEDVLNRLAFARGKVFPNELAKLKGVSNAANEISTLFTDIGEKLSPLNLSNRFQDSFETLAERASRTEWTVRLLEHHCRVQKDKPPSGKAPWFDRFDDGAYIIRRIPDREFGGRYDDSYVHSYRTKSLWSFARDLRKVR